ncbi:helix-turn-helix domain-containing protein [Clostridium sp.]|uniref:helix-turn-helix domain-containing protein n=1 Tax=Clostridium sp. TaxID=1506 RepID=UPI003995641C
MDLEVINKALGFIGPKDALNKVMSFGEACEKWNISESTLRMKVSRGALKENKEYRKSGKKINLITKSTMRKYYGESKEINN